MQRIKYKSGYKYQLAEDYVVVLPIPYSDYDIECDYLALSGTGVLRIRKGYAWDGPSGPTIEPVAEPKILTAVHEKSRGYARKMRKNAEALEGIFPKISPQNDPDLLHKMDS